MIKNVNVNAVLCYIEVSSSCPLHKIFLITILKLPSFQNMSSDTEQQQVVVALIDENEKSSPENGKQRSKERRPRKNYCTEEYLVYYGIPILIVILVIVGIIFVLLYIRRYNRNCSHTKGVSCRGSLWYFN